MGATALWLGARITTIIHVESELGAKWPTAPGLLVSLDAGLLILTLDRPDRANSLTRDQTLALTQIARSVSAGDGPRAILLRANGRHFCAGADISGNRGSGEKPTTGHMVRSLETGPHAMIAAMWDCPIPVVAAVQGQAAGLGLHLALTADVIIGAESATFRAPFAERGFNVDSGGSWLLSRRIGLTRATDMVLRARPIPAPVALSWGLITEVVPDAELDAAARASASTLAAGPTIALSQCKRLVRRNQMAELNTAMGDEALAVELCLRSDDFKEGMRAFGEKRPPAFTGR